MSADTDERRLIAAGIWTPPADRRFERLEAAASAERSRQPTFGECAEQWISGRKVKGRPLAPPNQGPLPPTPRGLPDAGLRRVPPGRDRTQA